MITLHDLHTPARRPIARAAHSLPAIGIRRAVGAGGGGVVSMVTRRIAWQVALGLGLGVLLGVPWSAVLADPVLNTRGGDPLVFASVVAVILLVAALASVAPLRRALRVDPLTALRQD